MVDPEARNVAAQCRHYAMCKIDFLGTGICQSGIERHFVSYYPQGRMDIYRGLADGVLPVTDALLDIADSCTLCGDCDMQCHFVTGLRPSRVMAALKDYVAEHRSRNKPVLSPPEDETLRRLQEIVGPDWASNDPAILFTYADDPFPLAGPRMPRYVVLPGSPEQTAAVVRLACERQIPYIARGNGGSVFGFVFSEGIVLDLNRMRRITVDPDNWTATVEAGVTSFELQKEVHRLGFRVNAAEPAATVCGNIVCTGIFSTWSNTYGTAADTFIDMEFVDGNGKLFRINDTSGPNTFAFEHAVLPAPGICTRAAVRLHPRTDDEEGMLIPFEDLDAAIVFARDLARRRIGIALAVLGSHYLANFMSPDKNLAEELKTSIPDVLGVRFAVFVVADKYAREAIRSMSESVVDAHLFRTLMLGLPRLADPDLRNVLCGLEGQTPAYEILCRPEMRSFVEAVLDPTPENIAGSVDEDLRPGYVKLYRRPEMTDMVWLNAFRIVSSRMSRRKHMFAFLIYLPIDSPALVQEIIAGFGRIADAHGIDHDYGFLTPLDMWGSGPCSNMTTISITRTRGRKRRLPRRCRNSTPGWTALLKQKASCPLNTCSRRGVRGKRTSCIARALIDGGRKGNLSADVDRASKNRDLNYPLFLTGGTGFLGSHLAVAFLRAGRQVILLARPKNGKSAEERVSSLFDWFYLDESFRRNARLVEGDVLLPEFGLAPQLVKKLELEGCDFIHCASDTSFSERKRPQVEAVNVGGLINILNFAASSRAGFLHLVSTAFVAGRTTGRCFEEPASPASFTNVYEETKCRGEWIARETCRRAGIGLAVYRPSIAYGDSQTGRSLSFNALYHPVRTLQFLRKIYEKDILERGGTKAAPEGIWMNRDGTMHFPCRIEVGGNGGLNLIPVDFFVDAFRALMSQARDGDCFHIVNDSLTPISAVAEYTNKFLKLEGMRTCRPEQMAETPQNALERLFAHYTETYGPYMKDERIFSTQRCHPILEMRGIACPQFNEAAFTRCMAYAVSVDWGAKLSF